MLRGPVRLEHAVVLGDGPHATALKAALEAADFCGAVGGPNTLAEADAVFVDAEVGSTAAALRRAISAVNPMALITDLCPVKSQLLSEIEAEIPSGYGYVASSVFPGREGSFVGATVALIPVMGSVPEAIERMRGVWEQLGAASVLQLDPETHDLWVAAHQLSAEVHRLAAEAAGADARLEAPEGALTPQAVARNEDFIDWLVQRLRPGS